ncbi:unnamed protein product [Protopolystoma xenopodis]|uniref:Transmembrane protein 107 n=1 Tax=Protopolystoma xenopodis TaxID=117903 RepID=A0A448XJE4_9PLAT|nr:unnamed protein product [Protopolystoma xenopodis]
MVVLLSELISWLRVTPFELVIHCVSLAICLFFSVLYDEAIWLIDRTPSQALWVIFSPLFTADAFAAYFNLTLLARHIHLSQQHGFYK